MTTASKEVTALAVRPPQAAKMLNISLRTLYNWTKTGKLKAIKSGNAKSSGVLYAVSDLQAFLSQAK
jgi:excisionase family DNA binding protein